jgi:hypothetical protein
MMAGSYLQSSPQSRISGLPLFLIRETKNSCGGNHELCGDWTLTHSGCRLFAYLLYVDSGAPGRMPRDLAAAKPATI